MSVILPSGRNIFVRLSHDCSLLYGHRPLTNILFNLNASKLYEQMLTENFKEIKE